LVDEQKAKATTKTKTSHEGKNKKPSTVQVSLDNADTVIEGGPLFIIGQPMPQSVTQAVEAIHSLFAK
jgi:hypothetical protein